MRNTRSGNVPIEEAIRRLLGAVEFHPETETIPVAEARGRVTAEPVLARSSTPPFSAAAMDGIALRSETVVTATPSRPVRLKEGRDFTFINTGEPMPGFADSVVMIEKVTVPEEGWVEVREAVPPFKHVRQPGEDVAEGEVVLPARHRIRPVDLGALLAAGVEELPVLRRPRVAIIPTGSEMVSPGIPLKRGQLREFNGTAFAGFLEEWGADPERRNVVPDRKEAIYRAVLDAAAACDMVVVNAGSSAGSRDYTPEVLDELGTVLLHGVAARPGHPVVLAVVKGVPVLGLPGYPVSAYLSLNWFARPLIRHWFGEGEERPRQVEARLTREVRTKTGSEDFIRMRVSCVNGEYVAAPLPRGAGVTLSMVRADAWLRVPADSHGYRSGDRVRLEIARPLESIRRTLSLTGCDDPLLDRLGAIVPLFWKGGSVSREFTGDRAGLSMLYRGDCHAVAVHGEGWQEEWQREGIRLARVRLAHREMGWVTVSHMDGTEPWGPDTRFIRRPPESETERKLEARLKGSLRFSPGERVEPSHWKAAASISEGTADLTVGPRSAARAFGLGFMPLWTEPLDLILPVRFLESGGGRALLEALRSGEFRGEAERLGGYDTSESGEVTVL
ncbi:molybdopterin molybdochelatase [Melghirimyces profundicolus]|uniref:Molybdopterin molybdenumtransferase n=1 Tax=Melghirimyces profundicolus TaxID=1242148 RepID=A0A2T6BS36_9BACL|nr:molybdopterin-binding protein [Melghirimyces profundicolus]PTX58856.1 molybdopterin molybdochelatase [Melghirimyces profundicolus]